MFSNENNNLKGGVTLNPVISMNDDILKCCVCIDMLIVPCTLSCGHSICKKCLTDLRKKECPICRTTFNVFSTNYVLDGILSRIYGEEYEKLKLEREMEYSLVKYRDSSRFDTLNELVVSIINEGLTDVIDETSVSEYRKMDENGIRKNLISLRNSDVRKYPTYEYVRDKILLTSIITPQYCEEEIKLMLVELIREDIIIGVADQYLYYDFEWLKDEVTKNSKYMSDEILQSIYIILWHNETSDYEELTETLFSGIISKRKIKSDDYIEIDRTMMKRLKRGDIPVD